MLGGLLNLKNGIAFFWGLSLPFLWYLATTYSPESVVNTITAIGTLLAVVVALFQDWIRAWWNRAILDLSLLPESPDCHQIRITRTDGKLGSNCIYLRVKVNNISQQKAEKVEIMVTRLWKMTPRGRELVSSFLPMNLKWSHYRTPNQNIPAETFKHCDIGPIFPFPGGAQMRFDTIVQPNQVSGGMIPNIIEAGKYQFELIATAENARSHKTLWNLEFDGVWVEDEKVMLSEHIKIYKDQSPPMGDDEDGRNFHFVKTFWRAGLKPHNVGEKNKSKKKFAIVWRIFLLFTLPLVLTIAFIYWPLHYWGCSSFLEADSKEALNKELQQQFRQTLSQIKIADPILAFNDEWFRFDFRIINNLKVGIVVENPKSYTEATTTVDVSTRRGATTIPYGESGTFQDLTKDDVDAIAEDFQFSVGISQQSIVVAPESFVYVETHPNLGQVCMLFQLEKRYLALFYLQMMLFVGGGFVVLREVIKFIRSGLW